ncbi:MAG TPA: ATP-binding protein [Patescibacteria group bacterium]|nr:ATP-binding protein [Patescibacteria group bacterium]
MSLRLRLALALMFTALLPMALVAGLPIVQAERRADDEAARHLAQVRRQAEILVARQQADLRERLARAAADLAASRTAAAPLQQGPASAARALTRLLAERHALDLLEIRSATGTLLATSASGAAPPLPLDAEALADGGIVLAEVPLASLPPPPDQPSPGEQASSGDPSSPGEQPSAPDALAGDAHAGDDGDTLPGPPRGDRALVSRRTITLRSETYVLLGGRMIGAAFVAGVAEITGGPAAIVDPSGTVRETAGAPEDTARGPAGGAPRTITADVVLAPGGWVVRVFAPAGDAAAVRRDARAAFLGVAPLALGTAVAVGALLAAGIARPVRALAARAEAITAEHAAPLTPVRATDEVRGLTAAFDRMLGALGASERQRLAAERVAAWQEVARRVAHEVRNALSPIGLAVENLRRTRERDPSAIDRALDLEGAAILDQVDSLRRLVDEFSRFARLPAPQPAPCDLRAVTEQALQFLAPRIASAGVEVTIDDGGAPHPVRADADQIGRAIGNVAANALDAMENAAVRRLTVTLRSAGARGGGEGGGVPVFEEIELRDTGPGLGPEALRRVFEPYFTTRGESGGTGLGMAIVHRIVTEHGGTVSVRSAGGAIVTLRLPAGGPPGGSREG